MYLGVWRLQRSCINSPAPIIMLGASFTVYELVVRLIRCKSLSLQLAIAETR